MIVSYRHHGNEYKRPAIQPIHSGIKPIQLAVNSIDQSLAKCEQ